MTNEGATGHKRLGRPTWSEILQGRHDRLGIRAEGTTLGNKEEIAIRMRLLIFDIVS